MLYAFSKKSKGQNLYLLYLSGVTMCRHKERHTNVFIKKLKRGLLVGLLLSSCGFVVDLADARTLAVTRAYTGGGNPAFPPVEHIRRIITADHEIQVTGTTDFDIQQKLNEAKNLALDNPDTTIVVTLDPTRQYDIWSPLVVHGNTVLEGNGAVLEVAITLDTALSRAITLRGDGSGIHSCDIRANSLVSRATVVVAAGATNTAIFDNRMSGDVETSGPPLIDVESNVTNLEIDGNELVNMTNGILLGQNGIDNVSIGHNRFANWYDRAVLVKNRNHETPVSNVDICGNIIEPPHLNGVVRQPIAFQSNTVGGAQVHDVQIRHNKIVGNDQPYITGQLDDFSEEDGEIVPIGNTGQYRLLNGAVADMISLQDVANFDVFANHLDAGGEAGINITRGSGAGVVRWNYVENQDTIGINIGSNLGANSTADDPLRVYDIEIFRNSIIDPGRNRADPNSNCDGPEDGDEQASVQRWARSGIALQFADDVTLHHNYHEETEAAFNTVCFGVYSRGNTTNLIIDAPTFDFVAEGVIWSPTNSSVDKYPLDFERLIGDANLDGVVDDADVCVLIDNWYQPGTWSAGDFTEDGFVDEIDFDLLLLNLYQEADYRPAPGRSDDNPYHCTNALIDFDDFENGWGIWNGGGSDSRRHHSTDWAVSGSYSIRLRDDSDSSVMTTDVLNLTDYDIVFIDFSYTALGMDTGDSFSLEVSKDVGATYQSVGTWRFGIDFQNKKVYTETTPVPGTPTSATQFRFRCDASSNNDRVHIDDVTISGTTVTE